MIKKIILPASLLALPSIVFTTVELFYLNASLMTQQYSRYLSILNIALGIGLMFFTLNRFKKNDANGYASFKSLFSYGEKVVLVWALIAATAISVIIKTNEKALNEIIDKSVKFQVENISDKSGHISAKQKKTMDQMVAIQKNPISLFVINLVLILILGTLYNLVASGILKSRKPTVAESQQTSSS